MGFWEAMDGRAGGWVGEVETTAVIIWLVFTQELLSGCLFGLFWGEFIRAQPASRVRWLVSTGVGVSGEG